ncbi:DNA-binding SARP family transcriptional activator [Kutzneria viridogrisea]|uniref:DNA-binding SARP family transcriptional activator n=1 Tax=Kutzneria viridogrisea TaxID=47990 RepID=A0ABR6BF73_9PSEU|nr:DNA-binding SARP family transcriptional activator [Kutzneria viridogrisea]
MSDLCTTTWWFEVLGALRAGRDGQDVPLGAPKQRVVLAILLLGRNTLVARDQIIEAVWGESAPSSAVNVVHTYVAGLRRALEPSRANRAPGSLLRSSGDGYLLRLPQDAVDLDVFEARVAAAGKLRAAGDLLGAHEVLDEALGLWRGEPLSGLPGLFAEVERGRLVERRLVVLEDRAELRLALGRGAEAVGELTRLVAENPLRERLHGMAMRALCQAGRQAEALSVYRSARQVLIEELGVEPGPELQRLHQAVLAGEDLTDPSPPVTTSRPVAAPSQLPRGPANFVGRQRELDRLAQLAGDTPAGLVVAVTGPAGVGKTALAVHWARDRFPDGQLYVDLHGYDPQRDPLDPAEVLRRFLCALGVPTTEVPATLDERSALFRTMLADRRLVVVLDNARGSQELLPLLPGAHSCVLVTSRRRLDGLVAHADAQVVDVALLSPTDAVGLLGRIAGEQRLLAEPEAALRLAALCDRLPLALRVAAARLAGTPRLSVAGLVAELDDERGRLAGLGLEGGDSVVRAAFDASRRALPRLPARLLTLLGVHPGADVTPHLAAALAQVGLGEATRALDALAAAHLLSASEPGRYAPHDLVRAYCVTLAAEELTAEEHRAVAGRMLDYYLHCADLADGLLPITRGKVPIAPEHPPAAVPVIDGSGTAMAWLEAERGNLLAAAGYAAAQGWTTHAWQLPYTMSRLFWLSADRATWLSTHEAAAQVVRGCGDAEAQFVTLHNLGVVLTMHERFAEALDAHREALAVSRREGHGERQARVLTSIANIHHETGQLALAEEHYLRAAEIGERCGARFAQANALHNLGILHADQQRHGEAEQRLRTALRVYAETGEVIGQTACLSDLVTSLLATGEVVQAMSTARRALEIAVSAASPYHQGIAHDRIAQALDAQRDPGAQGHWQRALGLLTELGAPETDGVRSRLARARLTA